MDSVTCTVKPVFSGHLGTQKTVLSTDVSLLHRFVYAHLYYNNYNAIELQMSVFLINPSVGRGLQ